MVELRVIRWKDQKEALAVQQAYEATEDVEILLKYALSLIKTHDWVDPETGAKADVSQPDTLTKEQVEEVMDAFTKSFNPVKKKNEDS